MNPQKNSLTNNSPLLPILGRADELKFYKKALFAARKPICLHGVGGVGKSWLAQTICSSQEEEVGYFALIAVESSIAKALTADENFWKGFGINFTEKELLRPDFESFAAECILRTLQELPNTTDFQLKNPGSANRRYLLAIDNVTEGTIDIDLIQKINWHLNWRIIITSRLPIAFAENYEVKGLDIETSCALFRRYCVNNEIANKPLFEQTIRLLQGNPLLISLLAKQAQYLNLLNLTDLSIQLNAKYREALPLKAAALAKSSLYYYEESIACGLSVCFNNSELNTTQKMAFTLLKYFVLLPNRPIRYSELKEFVQDSGIFTMIELDNSVKYLFSTGWLIQLEKGCLLHPVIADFILYNYLLPLSETEKMTLVKPLIAVLYPDELEAQPHTLPLFHILLNLFQRTLLLIDGLKTEEIAFFYSEIATIYRVLNNKKSQLVYIEKALKIYQKIFGEHHADTATFYYSTGLSYEESGDIQKGLEYQERALTIRRKLFGENHEIVAVTYGDLSKFYKQNGDVKKASQYKEKVLNIYHNLFGEYHANTAKAYIDLGLFKEENGNKKEGIDYLEKGLEIQKKVLGENHADTATSYYYVGRLYHENAEIKKGLK
ncbi:MAG: hypothetical protein RI894_2429, partial [Bacteroidota bacterium]